MTATTTTAASPGRGVVGTPARRARAAATVAWNDGCRPRLPAQRLEGPLEVLIVALDHSGSSSSSFLSAALPRS